MAGVLGAIIPGVQQVVGGVATVAGSLVSGLDRFASAALQRAGDLGRSVQTATQGLGATADRVIGRETPIVATVTRDIPALTARVAQPVLAVARAVTNPEATLGRVVNASAVLPGPASGRTPGVGDVIREVGRTTVAPAPAGSPQRTDGGSVGPSGPARGGGDPALDPRRPETLFQGRATTGVGDKGGLENGSLTRARFLIAGASIRGLEPQSQTGRAATGERVGLERPATSTPTGPPQTATAGPPTETRATRSDNPASEGPPATGPDEFELWARATVEGGPHAAETPFTVELTDEVAGAADDLGEVFTVRDDPRAPVMMFHDGFTAAGPLPEGA